jgi:hypothetical protein
LVVNGVSPAAEDIRVTLQFAVRLVKDENASGDGVRLDDVHAIERQKCLSEAPQLGSIPIAGR